MKWFMLQDEIDRIEALEIEAARRGDTVELEAMAPAAPNIRRGVARINIEGPMFKGRRPMLEMLGIPHATYPGIIAQIQAAEKAGAKQIDVYADSPGGHVSGLYEAMATMKSASAHTRVITNGTLASAMYILASQADEIQATNEAVEIGSVGVAMPIGSGKYITNTDSPKKHPDLSTDEGKAAAVEPLDDVFQIYVERTAEGRGTTVDNIKANYGQGGTMTARTALSKGMIDGIMQSNQPAKPAATIGAKMDIANLKAEHPALYAQVLAMGEAAGSKVSAETERTRVEDHLKLEAMSGDMEKARADIKSGAPADMSAMIHHQAAKAKRDEISARAGDNPPDVDANGTTPGDGNAEAAKGAAELAAFTAKYEGAMVL